MRKNSNYYPTRSTRSSNNSPNTNKNLLIRHTTKNSVAPFRSSKDSKRSSASPANSVSSSQSPSPQVTLSETILSNFVDDSEKSTESFISSQGNLFSKEEFNSMLEFDELNLPEIEISRKSSNISIHEDDTIDTEKLQYSMMSQISHISDLSKSQIQTARNRTRLSNIGNSLYELSMHLRTITDVRTQFLYFRDNAPLKYYSYSCLSELLMASLSCPPDMPYYILTMGAMMVKTGNIASSYDLKFYIRVTELLMSNPETFFVSFHADQITPQKNLRKMLAIFKGKLVDLDVDDDEPRKMTTSQVEDYIKKKNKVKVLYFYSNHDDDSDVESIQLEFPFSVDLRKRTPNYHPLIELDERATLRFEAFPDMYTKEEQKTVCFIKELNNEIPPKIGSPIIRFLSSSDNLLVRRKRGNEVYKHLSSKEIKVIMKLCSLFTSWDVAYDASLSVWEVMQHSDKFDIEALLSQLPVSYGDFLVEAVKSFAEMEGIRIGAVKNVR